MFDTLINKIKDIQSTQGNSIVMIGIDGGGGSGKTTLAAKIESKLSDTQIIHMDDFFKLKKSRKMAKLADAPSGYEYDIDRLISQVIMPILSNKTAKYQKYDWGNDELSGCEEVVPTGVLIIEGCYSIINRLRDFYQLNIFVDCNRATRLERGLARDGESALQFWINWMEGEDKYFAEQDVKNNADFVFISDGKE